VQPRNVIRATWPYPSGGLRLMFQRQQIAIAPNGTFVAVMSANSVTVRHLNQLADATLRGTDDVGGLFVSPDSEWIGYLTWNGIRKVRPGGGAPSWILQVSDTGNYGPLAAFWADDNRVYYSDTRGIHAISADGGEPQTIVAGSGASAPHVLPGSRAMLYHRGTASEIVLHPLDGSAPVVLASGVGARYIEPGILLFVRDGALMGARLDVAARRLSGEPVALGEAIAITDKLAQYDVASDGTLVYLPPSGIAEVTATLLRRMPDGRVEPLADSAQQYSDPRVSPDGRLIALHVLEKESDIWIHDTARGTETRLTFDPREDETPVWSPDGDWIAFAGFVRNGHERASGAGRMAAETKSCCGAVPTTHT
jgi:hypothetical protein